MKISWDSVLDYGVRLRDKRGNVLDGWLSKNGTFEYTNGYKALRTLVIGDNNYNLQCSIHCSTLNKPLFKLTLINKADEVIVKTFSGMNPTVTVKKLFSELGESPKGNYSGPYIFGFYKNEIIEKIRHECKSEEIAVEFNETSTLDDVSLKQTKRMMDWLGVVSLGEFNKNPKFLCHIGKKAFKLQVGYESIRQVKISNNESVLVHCKIGEADGEPLFECFSDTQPIFRVKDKKPTKVCKEAFKHLNVISKKKWSGYEFFGLTRSDVFNQICLLEENDEETSDDDCQENISKKSCTSNKPLRDLLNIRHRNAGPTNELNSKRAQKERNEKIKSLVEYASFGDIKGNK